MAADRKECHVTNDYTNEMADRGECPVILKPLTPVTMVTRDTITKHLATRVKDNLPNDFGIETSGDMDDDIACQLRQKYVTMEAKYLSTKKNLINFRGKVKRRDIRLKSLRVKVEEAEKSTSKMKKELMLAINREKELNTDVERMKVQHSNSIKKLEKQYQEATKMADDFKAQLEATQDQNQNYAIRIADLQEEITRSKLEKEQFESQLKFKVSKIENDAMEAIKEEINRTEEIKKKMTSQIEHLIRKSDGMEKLVNQLEKTLSELEAEKDEYQHRLEISSDNLTVNAKRLRDLEKKHHEMEQENADLHTKQKKLEIDQHKLENELEEKKETNKKALKENEELAIQLDSAQQECVRLKEDLNERIGELNSLQKDGVDSNHEIKRLSNALQRFRQMMTAAGISTGVISSVDQEIDIGMIVQSYEDMKAQCCKLEQEIKNSKMLPETIFGSASSTTTLSSESRSSKENGSSPEMERLRFKMKTQDLMITKLRFNLSVFQQGALSNKGSLSISDMPVVDRAIMTLIPLEEIPIILESQLEPWNTVGSEPIGKGTFGEVFLKRLGPDAVAVKVQGIQEDQKDGTEDLKKLQSLNHSRTMKEVAVLRLLNTHPVFPRCHGYIRNASCPGLVVEFLGDKDTGTVYSLSKAIKTKNPALLDHEWLNIVIDITEGIHAMHERDLLHNDIKPNNVLLQKDDRWKAYIIDMGNVTSVNMPHKNRNLTDHEIEGYKLGVVYQHLAPEYILDGEYSSIQSDIFSLGRILHYVSRVTHNSELFNLATSMIDSYPHRRPSWKEINRVINRRTMSSYETI